MSILSLSLAIFPSLPLPLISLHMCLSENMNMYQQADTRYSFECINTSQSAHAKIFIPFHDQPSRSLSHILSWPLTLAIQIFYRQGSFLRGIQSGRGGGDAEETSVEDFDPKQAGACLIHWTEVGINMPSFLAHTVIQGCWEEG